MTLGQLKVATDARSAPKAAVDRTPFDWLIALIRADLDGLAETMEQKQEAVRSCEPQPLSQCIVLFISLIMRVSH